LSPEVALAESAVADPEADADADALDEAAEPPPHPARPNASTTPNAATSNAATFFVFAMFNMTLLLSEPFHGSLKIVERNY
jgi:hypothetical protein